MSMSSAPRASQLSGSTIYPSTTSLSSLTNASTIVSPPPGGQVVATTNIINQKADASRSLYQICVAIRNRLALVPGFEDYMAQLNTREQETGDAGGPVEGLWGLLRTGLPLLAIYNATDPDEPLIVDVPGATDAKKGKLAIAKFVQGCSKELKIPPSEMFIVADLLGTDTSGFSKVLIVINLVLDIAQQRGLLKQPQAPYGEVEATGPAGASKMSYRDHIIRELVDTERKYVQDLENLHDLKKTLEQKGAISGDVAHSIFLNINSILDFQRRFLIRVETTNSMPPARQEWGSPFVAYEDSFNTTYQPFIANQRKAAQIASQNFDKIQAAEHPVACDYNTLDGFLLKPMQRLVKYPLLLKDLRKKSEDEAVKEDLGAGIEAAERVLKRANEAVDRDLLDEALEELVGRVDDWKNHRVEHFGKLLLHGVYTVVTGKTDQERDYEIYLFECILLCCKEITPNKSKEKKDKTKSAVPPKARNKNNKLQLKGRIFMTNVTEVLSFSKPGSYTVQIWWKGDPGVENFVIKFQNEEMMKKWAAGLDNQRKENAPLSATSPDQTTANFRWMEAQGGDLVNPYAEHDDEDEEFTPPPTSHSTMQGTMPRTGSSTSLRQRSGTQESSMSLAGMVRRQPPPSFPLPQPPNALSLQTGPQSHQSPGARGGDSYFSPVAESPASSRTSTTSSFFGHSASYIQPRNGLPPTGWSEDNNRYTAPAMPRAPSRDGPSPVNAYGVNGRNPRGPSLPAMATSSQSLAAQQRSRSYSTPDINGQPQQPVRRTERGGSQGVPAVPGIPPHLHPAHDGSIPRSHTGSPRQELPIRANTQSPGVQNRLQQQNQGGGGQMAQFPAQPVNRQHTPGPINPGLMPAPLNLDSSRTVSSGSHSSISGPTSNPLASPTPNDMPFQSQLKVKINCDSGNYVTLVAAFNITYQSLTDRIDAKLSRFTNSSIGKGSLRLRYRDEDGDFVNIESDEDIQIAFSDWRENIRSMYSGGMGEIELFCVGDMA
ncbi:Rho guanine nucleotide exchange factor scd1 [Cytospora mali]|uniref:Rho guanine nucleotide exchange factor scd1 n=1 Tax=Cytospora mali TaxID=578113 RepID=A0A194WCT7_CYTMA|nr:Rho guanine nucleotide exchange factor scd1 [Valsa mali]